MGIMLYPPTVNDYETQLDPPRVYWLANERAGNHYHKLFNRCS